MTSSYSEKIIRVEINVRSNYPASENTPFIRHNEHTRFLQCVEAEDKGDEILRRRRCGEPAIRTVENVIAKALRNLRTHHFDMDANILVACKDRSNCVRHLRWESVRKFRDALLENGKTVAYSSEEVYQYQKTLTRAASID
uniref:Uncharacterized protein n=1 Tax=Caenorhabditis japonica TaxID=281687 RepID=A0A8R1ID39_CAEJA